MRILHSKHQKLILQCYPPGKGVDKKPNPLELSYLLYYASTRRVKLEKVIEFLKKKTRADVRGRKLGNLLVTLSIILLLIEKCFENLNAFAPQVCDILRAILTLKELPLCKSAVATYAVFCSKLDNALFTGDKGFVDLFSRLTQDFIAISEAELAVHATNKREWKMVSLRTCRYVFSCLGYNSQLSGTFIPASIAILAPTVSHSLTHESLTSRLKSALNVEQGAGERLLTKVNTGKSQYAVNYDARDSFDEDSLSESDLGEEALLGLRTLFHTSLSHQISAATRLVVEHGFHNRKEGASFEWGTTFLQVCASYIPVQLRFETLLTLLDSLSQIANDPKAKEQKSWFLHMRHYAQYTLSLISSGFNMIGLSISDILLHFLTLKTDLYTKLSEKLTQSEVSELSTIYSKCICYLSSHIYYFDQVSDSIEGILMQVDSVLLAAEARYAEKIHVLVLDLLDMISTIMELLAVNSSAISWNHATLENWDVSFQLLTFKKSYAKFSAMVSHETVVGIQTKYLGIVEKFLDRDILSKDTKMAQDDDGMSIYLEPNYKNYIQDRGNTLYSLILHCGDYFQEEFFDAGNAMAMSKILAIFADITGINFAYNFFSVFPLWQLHKLPESRPPSRAAVAKDLCAYHLLTVAVYTINEKYQHILDESIANLSLARSIVQNIRMRTAYLWTDLGPQQDVYADQLTLGSIEAFFSQTPLKQWLLPSTSVLGEFENGESHSVPRLNILGPELDDDISFLSAVPNPGSTLGLGTANDISSIYSGLHNNCNGQGNGVYRAMDLHTPDTSQITQTTLMTHRGQGNHDAMSFKRVFMPKADDLKLTVHGKGGFSGNDVSSARLILQRPVMTDVASILEDLNIEDDRDIIV